MVTAANPVRPGRWLLGIADVIVVLSPSVFRRGCLRGCSCKRNLRQENRTSASPRAAFRSERTSFSRTPGAEPPRPLPGPGRGQSVPTDDSRADSPPDPTPDRFSGCHACRDVTERAARGQPRPSRSSQRTAVVVSEVPPLPPLHRKNSWHVQLDSVPRGAQVRVGERLLGTTPLRDPFCRRANTNVLIANYRDWTASGLPIHLDGGQTRASHTI